MINLSLVPHKNQTIQKLIIKSMTNYKKSALLKILTKNRKNYNCINRTCLKCGDLLLVMILKRLI